MPVLLCVNLKIIFQNTCRIRSFLFFAYKDLLNHSQRSRVIYKAWCWHCNDFYIGKTKRWLHDRKTEYFKSLTKNDHSSAIADHIIATGHYIKWDHFEILASGITDYHCKIKETLFIQDLKPTFNVNIKFISCCLLYSLLLLEFLISFPDPLQFLNIYSRYFLQRSLLKDHKFENVC